MSDKPPLQPASVLVSHPTGNTFSRALIEALWKEGALARFVTSLALPQLDHLPAPAGIRAELRRRHFAIPSKLIASHPGRELARLACQRLGIPVTHEEGWCSVDAIYASLDRYCARLLDRAPATLRAVYGYEDGALETFTRAGQLGLKRFYDLPIAYWETARRLVEQEAERLPEWVPTMGALHDSARKTARKTAELELADAIVCPSDFVLESLPAAARARAIVAPFGSPPARPPVPRKPGPLRVLFAGSMTQRKGLADVFAAMRLLERSDIELVVFGSPIAPMEFYRRQYADFRHVGPRPHGEVLRLMETCDLLLLPSIVEGRALVQQEAMSCGLPLIITPNTGGGDLVVEGRTGFLVPIRSPEAIAGRLDWVARHREALESMREETRALAAERSWANYTRILLQALAGAGSSTH